MYTSLPTNLSPGSVVDTYLRDSGGPRQDKSTSQQLNEISEYCARYNLILREAYVDARKSGGSTVGRDQFARMMEFYKHKTNRPAALLLWNYARFARDIDDAQFHKIVLRRQWGIIVHSISDQIPEGKYGKLAEYFIDLANEEKREQASYEARRGLRDLVQIHGCVPGVPPTGFRRIPVDLGDRKDKSKHIAHRWEIDSEYIHRIKRAFEMRAVRTSNREINAETRLFNSLNSYKTFFTNKIYIGILEFGDLVIEDYCPPIVDRETWDAVQAIIKEYSHSKFLTNPRSHPSNNAELYPLTGIARCARCNSPMAGMTSGHGKGTYYYRYACVNAKRGAGCDLPAIPAKPVENKIIETLADFLRQPDIVNALLEENRVDDQSSVDQHKNAVKEKQSDLVKVRRYIANISAAIRENGHSATLLSDLKRYEEEERESQTAIQKAQTYQTTKKLTPEEITVYSADMDRLLHSNDSADVSAALRYLLVSVHLDRDKTAAYVNVNYRLLEDDLKKNSEAHETFGITPPLLLPLIAKCASITEPRGGTYL